MKVRVRFAPSPTGFLHIGGVRTALFNWLYARHHGGQFLLRIEDTDTERSEERYTQDILSSLKWLGLTWDEDLTFQSKRLEMYKREGERLLQEGKAYRCYCTEAELEAMREKAQAEGRKPQYDRRCRDFGSKLIEGKPFVIRAKIPVGGAVEFEDLIRGPIRFENEELDDFVIVRSNGAPTYNFVVVVDDAEMAITHVIRGEDHINNTPKQIHVYQALGAAIPRFAHLPMIFGADKKKLSKRHGDVSSNAYRGEGFLPESILIFLVRLGWSHGDQEVFSMEEMIKFFELDHVQKSGAVFNVEKLHWLSGTHLRAAQPERLAQIVTEDFGDFFKPDALARVKTELGHKLIALIQPKVKTVKEIAEQLVPLCTSGVIEVDPSVLKWKTPENEIAIKAAIKGAVERLGAKLAGGRGSDPSLESAGVTAGDIDALLRQVCDERGVKLGDLAQPMRLAITGRLVSAGLFEILAALPWSTCEQRLNHVQRF